MRALAVALLLAGALAARAQGDVPARDAATAEAKARFRRGSELYREARYREAIVEFEAANRLRPHGAISYNLAQCHERLGELAAALASYGEYLRAVPDAADRARVSAAMADLEARLGPAGVQPSLATAALAVSPAPPPALDLTAPAPAPLPRPRVWTWVAAGAAAVALAAGGAYAASAQSASSDLRSAAHDGATAQRLADTATSRSRTANTLYGVAAVAGAASVTLFFVEGRF